MIRDSRFSSPGAVQKASSLIPCFLSASISASNVGNVLGAPVVGEVLEPEPLEHGRAIFRARVSCCRTGRCTRRSGCRARRVAWPFPRSVLSSAGRARLRMLRAGRRARDLRRKRRGATTRAHLRQECIDIPLFGNVSSWFTGRESNRDLDEAGRCFAGHRLPAALAWVYPCRYVQRMRSRRAASISMRARP